MFGNVVRYILDLDPVPSIAYGKVNTRERAGDMENCSVGLFVCLAEELCCRVSGEGHSLRSWTVMRHRRLNTAAAEHELIKHREETTSSAAATISSNQQPLFKRRKRNPKISLR